jgi:hypothetical protein
MAGQPIQIKQYFVYLLLARNLQLHLDNQQKYGTMNAIHPHRYLRYLLMTLGVSRKVDESRSCPLRSFC